MKRSTKWIIFLMIAAALTIYIVSGNTKKAWNELDTLVDVLESETEEFYSAESWNKAEAALSEAKDLPENASRKDIEAATQKLDSVLSTLTDELNGELDSIIDMLESEDKYTYTLDSWNELEKVLSNAKSLSAGATREEINNSINKLMEASNALEKARAKDTAKLEAAIQWADDKALTIESGSDSSQGDITDELAQANDFYKASSFVSAEVLYDGILSIDADNLAALNNGGLTKLQLNKPEEALKYFLLIHKLYPDSYQSYMNTLIALHALGCKPGDAMEALESFVTAIQDDPDFNSSDIKDDIDYNFVYIDMESQDTNPDQTEEEWLNEIQTLLDGIKYTSHETDDDLEKLKVYFTGLRELKEKNQ